MSEKKSTPLESVAITEPIVSTEPATPKAVAPEVVAVAASTETHPLNDRWWLWMHGMRDTDYSKDSYKRIGEPLVTVEQYLGLWGKLKESVSDSMFFLMRHGNGSEEPIYPMWEDKQCSNGGAWKFRVPLDQSVEAFHEIAIRLIGETISENPEEILGLSISPKKKAVTIRVWNSDDNKRDHAQLNLPDKDYFKEVLYDAHQDYKN